MIGQILQLYRTQFELLWRWRPGRWALVKRGIVSFLAALIAFYLTAWLLPGQLQVASLAGGVAAVVLIAALNLLVRPILIGLVASRSVVMLVALTILFQVFVFWLLDPLVGDVTVSAGFLGLLLVSFVFGFLQAGVSSLFGLGEDDSYYGTLVRTMASHRPDVTRTDEPGLVIVQLDGLSHDVMSHAVRAGRVPEMSSWLRDGSHRLGHWDALLPSTTPASQAGILHGNNDGIPNFRWWEKKARRLLVANHPEDATEIERRISNGEGLLSPGGTSISNIFTGDADRAFLVMSTIKVKERGLGQSDAFAWFFVSPYNYMVMGAKYLGEVVKERVQSWRQARAGIVPYMGHHRSFPYPLVRAATNVALRALGTSLIIQEMYRGTPVIYMDYTDYDEIAHHSGPERPESLDALDGVDRELRTLKKAAEDAARPYRFVILADHGQSLGQTFLQRYGVTLQEVVRSLMGGEASVAAATAQVEDWGQLNTFLGEVSETKGVSGSLARAVTHDRRSGEQVELGPQEAQFTPAGAPVAPEARHAVKGAPTDESAADAAAEVADLVVVAGGNLALIYFNASDERMTLDQIEERLPGPRAGARQPPRHRHPHGAHGGPRHHRRGQAGHPLPGRRSRRGRGPAGGLRRPGCDRAQAARRHRARRRHRGRQPVRPRDGRDRRLRGAHRRARRPGRRADPPLPALPGRLGAGPRARSSGHPPCTASCGTGWSSTWACASDPPATP